MLLLDVNVVLAAQRADHPQHHVVRPWLEGVRRSGQSFGVPSSVWASFLRLTTNRRIFPVPTPLDEAFAFLAALEAQPGCGRLEPGARHWMLVRRLCEEGDAVGDLVPDALLAAVALENGCVVATLDRDFLRFPSVRSVRPEAVGEST